MDQQNIVCTSKEIVRAYIETVDKEKFVMDMAGNIGRKPLPRFDGPKMILIVFMVCWGIAMFLVLGVIVYLPILMAQPPNPQD